MEGLITASKIDLRYSESKIVFSISDCSLHKKYSFWGLTKEQAKDFIDRLRYLEKFTWRQISGFDRKHGLTTEKKDSDSFSMIDEQNSSETKLVEHFYFHMRIDLVGVFRIFGYQNKSIFCITHIDREGAIHHS